MLHTPTSQPLFIRHKSAAELLEKQAAAVARMPDDDKRWPAQVLSEMHKQLPFLSRFDVDIEMTRVEPEAGYAIGYAMLRNKTGKQRAAEELGKPTNKIRVPVIVADRLLQPFHVFEVGGKTYPLTQGRLESAMMNPSMFDGISDPPGTQSLLDQIYPPFQHRQGYGMMSGDRATTGVSKISSAPRVTKTASGEFGPLREFLQQQEIEKIAVNLMGAAAGKGIGAALQAGTLAKGSEEFAKAIAAARAAKAANPLMVASRGQVRSGAVRAVAPIAPGGANLKVKGAVRGPAVPTAPATPVDVPRATAPPAARPSSGSVVPVRRPAPNPTEPGALAAPKSTSVEATGAPVTAAPRDAIRGNASDANLSAEGSRGASPPPKPEVRDLTTPRPTPGFRDVSPVRESYVPPVKPAPPAEGNAGGSSSRAETAPPRKTPAENLDGPISRDFPGRPAAEGAGPTPPPPVGEAEPRLVRQALPLNRGTQVREPVPLQPAPGTALPPEAAPMSRAEQLAHDYHMTSQDLPKMSPGAYKELEQTARLASQRTGTTVTAAQMYRHQNPAAVAPAAAAPGFFSRALSSAAGGATMLGLGAVGGGMMMANKASENY